MIVEKDQHFLINQLILNLEIKESFLNKEDKVIEIGSGKGILTEELAKQSKKVLAFEIDKQFKENLDKLKKKYKNLNIIYNNALDYSFKGYNKVISNIPYSLSEPLILKAIKDEIPFLVLIIGENFKDILLLNESKIGVISNLFYNIHPITLVKKEDFKPKPSVNSFLVRLESKQPTKVENLLRKIVMKEGKIKNAILYSLVSEGKTKKQSKELIKSMKIPEEILNKPIKKVTGKFLIRLKELIKDN